MVQHLLLFLLFLLSFPLLGQDERYYRQILSGELPMLSQGDKEVNQGQFTVPGPIYLLDLDGDKVEESLQPQKRDGVDWIEIRDANNRRVFESMLFTAGAESVLYKVKLVSISNKVRALMLFLDEGFTAGKEFESTGRIFVISWEGSDFSAMKISQGPHMFHEKKSVRDQYFRRGYQVNVVDFNNDGVKEIAIQFNHIQRIMEYAGNGEWRRH